jgi:hypothetical protein
MSRATSKPAGHCTPPVPGGLPRSPGIHPIPVIYDSCAVVVFGAHPYGRERTRRSGDPGVRESRRELRQRPYAAPLRLSGDAESLGCPAALGSRSRTVFSRRIGLARCCGGYGCRSPTRCQPSWTPSAVCRLRKPGLETLALCRCLVHPRRVTRTWKISGSARSNPGRRPLLVQRGPDQPPVLVVERLTRRTQRNCSPAAGVTAATWRALVGAAGVRAR